jgi:hypothetical protein
MNLATRLVLGASVLLACAPALAEEQKDDGIRIQVASALVCDTQQQVERFVTVFDGNAENALDAVNKETVNEEQASRQACDIATIAYVMGPEVATTRTSAGTFRIVRVLVVGVLTENGLAASVPTPFYSAAKLEEQEV